MELMIGLKKGINTRNRSEDGQHDSALAGQLWDRSTGVRVHAGPGQQVNIDKLLGEPEHFDIPSARPVGLVRYDEVQALHAAGATTEAVADALGLSQRAVLDVLARADKPKLTGDQRARQLRMARQKRERTTQPTKDDQKAEAKRAKAEQAKKQAPKTRQPRTRTPEQIALDAEILRLLKAGDFALTIAKRLGTYPERVRAIRDANGIPIPPKGRPSRDDVTLRYADPTAYAERRAQQDDAILTGLLRGETQRAISHRLGVHARRVAAVRDANGIPAPGRGNRTKRGQS